MKKYLMTWYGITDLRASLELEKSDGPILSALLAEDYSDIIILGYTNPDKDKKYSELNKDDFHKKVIEISQVTSDERQSVGWQFIDKFSNTNLAHNHFIEWLKGKAQEHHKTCKINIQPVFLQHLNDTEGIYNAAIKQLESVSLHQGKKLVTLYLSPGTPVMAFVWAFASLRHPNLKKRMIASPKANRPPETVALPNEWLEWHGKQINSQKSNHEQYDVIFHLFGEQRMPNLLGVLQFTSKVHVFVNSAKFPAGVMKQFITDGGFYEVSVDPFDPENVRAKILEKIEELPSDVLIGFNLTGGTKLMYAGALNACRKINATPFYFDNKNNKVVFLNDFETIDIKPIKKVDTFLNLNGDDLHISKQGYWSDIPNINLPERKRLTLKLWNVRYKIHKHYKALLQYNSNSDPFDIPPQPKNNISVKLETNYKAEIRIGNEAFKFSNWPDFAKYLCGGWLEEYTYMLLEPFVKSGHIHDLRIGLEVSINDSISSQYNTYQEFDIVFTDGNQLYIIECKAGYLNSSYIMKLQNIIRKYGGIQGKGILASCFSTNNSVVRKKISDSNNIQLVSANDFPRQLEDLIKGLGKI